MTPSIGRFITEDPAKDGLNWYVYCANNPVNFADPWGLFDYNTIYRIDVPYNKEIEILQNELSYLGFYQGNIDGLFGTGTKDAVKAFQSSRGLTVDGVVGKDTWSALGLIYRAQEDIDAGMRIVTSGLKQYFDISNPVNNALYKAKTKFYQHKGDVEWFINHVKNDGEWNIKADAKRWSSALGISENSYNREVLFYGRVLVIDDIGNITFGYLGKASGFSDYILKGGSLGYHLINHGFSNFDNEWQDENYIQLGIDWYNGADISVKFERAVH